MALKVYQRKSGWFHIRGTHHGIVVDQSARTRSKEEAEGVREKLEREIYEERILGKAAQRSFAEASIDYMESGGEARYLEDILTAVLNVNGRAVRFGDMLLDEIDQSVVNDLVRTIKPNVKGSTADRSIFTPVVAVLNHAKRQRKKYQYAGIELRRPKVDIVPPDWKMPDEIEWWLQRCKHLAALITAYTGTGARASELIGLQWNNVSPDQRAVALWERDTKTAAPRSVVLQKRVRDVWPIRSKGHVFLNSKGKPWGDYRAVNDFLWKITERETRSAADRADNEELKRLKRLCRTMPIGQRPNEAYRTLILKVAEQTSVPRLHVHTLRHTWATWAYAVTRDITFVQVHGGWTDLKLVARYMHSGTADLGDVVRAYGWTMREDVAASTVTGRKSGS